MPVGTSARSPGSRSTSTVVTRSAPASPGWAYDGSGRSGSSRVIRISQPMARDPIGRAARCAAPGARLSPCRARVPARTTSGCGVPLRWWALATMFLATPAGSRSWSPCPPWVALAGTGVAARPPWSRLLRRATAPPASRSPTACCTAGRARIPVDAPRRRRRRSTPRPTRRLAGRDADARAYLLLRPYLRRAVRVDDRRPGRPDAVLAGQHPAPRPARRRRSRRRGTASTELDRAPGGYESQADVRHTGRQPCEGETDGFGLEGLDACSGSPRPSAPRWWPARR